MPELPPAEGVTRAVLGFDWQGQRCANVLHFTQADGVNAPNPVELGERLATWWLVSMRPLTHSSCSLLEVVCTDLSTVGAPGSVVTTGLPSPGTFAGVATVNNATVVMSARTALRGRSFRGRTYVVGLGSSAINTNALTPTHKANLLTAFNELVPLEGDGGEPVYNPVVLSYWSNHAVRGTPVATEIAQYVTDGVIDSQRRRLPGRGS